MDTARAAAAGFRDVEALDRASVPNVAAYPPMPRGSVVDLQPFRETTSVSVPDRGEAAQTVTLVDLNPHANAWFLLRVERAGDLAPAEYHLENADPAHRRLHLDPGASGLVIDSGRQHVTCDLWSGGDRSELALARASGRTYAPLCGNRLFLRNPTEGHRTYKEWAADFLRDHIWRGDRITAFVKDSLLRDSALPGQVSHPSEEPASADPAAPAAALVEPAVAGEDLDPVGLGLRLDGAAEGLDIGRWYRVHGTPGVFASVLQPGRVADAVRPVKALDPVESDALVYSVAFDLADFDLGFAVGTDHPRVDWSERPASRPPEDERPGPDGIGTIQPLVRTGRLNPVEAGRVAATFIGGFKRIHGAFRDGPLAKVNEGSHYGFVEQGVVLSKLQPGLATVVVYDNGRVDLKTWTEKDDASLARVRYARQNGVPLVEFDGATRTSKAGGLVGEWGAGNWSGSADDRLRTMRAGLGLQESAGRRFLIYSFFSSATPAAMARVFEAYGARYAMLLDMNALEHTYLAVYHPEGSQLLTEHLIEGMSAVDQTGGGGYVPRFVGFSDNRDFFYLLRRAAR